MVSQGLTLFIKPQAPVGLGAIWSGPSSSKHLPFPVGFSHLQNNTGNVHQILLSINWYFQREQKQRPFRKACGGVGKTPKGPAWLLILDA